MIEESGVSDPGLGTAGSKIFVGGLDRSVDEGTTRSARGLHFPVIRSAPDRRFLASEMDPERTRGVHRPHARLAGLQCSNCVFRYATALLAPDNSGRTLSGIHGGLDKYLLVTSGFRSAGNS